MDNIGGSGGRPREAAGQARYANGDQQLRQLARRAVADPALVVRALEAARSAGSGLATLDPADTRHHLRAVTSVVVEAFTDHRPLTAAEREVVAHLGADRAHQYVPLPALLTGFQAARNELLRSLVASARADGVRAAVLVDGLVELDSLLIDVQQELVQAHVQAEAALRSTTRDVQAGVVRQVLLGSLPAPGLAQLARAGLDGRLSYRCLVTTSAEPEAMEAMERYLVHAGTRTAVLDGCVVGLTALALPGDDLPYGLLVVTPPAALDRLAPLYRLALHARDSAAVRGSYGVRRLEDLALVSAGSVLSELGMVLSESIGGLVGHGRAYEAQLVLTALDYLEHGGGAQATALRLRTHLNTVKYRLRRLSEKSPWLAAALVPGAGLDTRFGAWLALSSWAGSPPAQGEQRRTAVGPAKSPSERATVNGQRPSPRRPQRPAPGAA